MFVYLSLRTVIALQITMCLYFGIYVDVLQAGDSSAQLNTVFHLFFGPQALALLEAVDLFFDPLVGFLHGSDAHLFLCDSFFGSAIEFFHAFGALTQQRDTQ